MIFDSLSDFSQDQQPLSINNSQKETSLHKLFLQKMEHIKNDNFALIYNKFEIFETEENELTLKCLTDNEQIENPIVLENFDNAKNHYQNHLVESVLSTSSSDEHNLNTKESSKYELSLKTSSLSPKRTPNLKNCKNKSCSSKKKKDFFLKILQISPIEDEEIKKYTYKKKFKFNLTKEEECSICTENFANKDIVCKIKQCQHLFHQECLDKWIKVRKESGEIRCPLCKTFI